MLGVLCSSLEMTFLQKFFLQMTGLFKVFYVESNFCRKNSYCIVLATLNIAVLYHILTHFPRGYIRDHLDTAILFYFNSCMEDSPMKVFGEIYKL